MHRIAINFLGLLFNIETDSLLLAESLEKYQPLSVDICPDDRAISIKMWSENCSFIIAYDRDGRIVFNEEDDAVACFNTLFLGICAEGLRARFNIYHGAAVSYDNDAFVLLGNPNAGKTTLALSLLKRGFRLLCDDLAIMELETGFVYPLKRKISIDKKSTFAKFFPLEKFDLSRNNAKVYVDLEDIFDENHWGGQARLKIIVFLEEAKQSLPEIRLLKQYEGLIKLGHFYRYGKSRRDLRIMLERNCKALEDVRCYLLRQGNITETTELLEETLLKEKSNNRKI